MSDLQARFAQAQQDVNRLVERPDNDTMLKLYALYKQATQGDATGERPSSFEKFRGDRQEFEQYDQSYRSSWTAPADRKPVASSRFSNFQTEISRYHTDHL